MQGGMKEPGKSSDSIKIRKIAGENRSRVWGKMVGNTVARTVSISEMRYML